MTTKAEYKSGERRKAQKEMGIDPSKVFSLYDQYQAGLKLLAELVSSYVYLLSYNSK